jgi:hypothetical protein
MSPGGAQVDTCVPPALADGSVSRKREVGGRPTGCPPVAHLYEPPGCVAPLTTSE